MEISTEKLAALLKKAFNEGFALAKFQPEWPSAEEMWNKSATKKSLEDTT